LIHEKLRLGGLIMVRKKTRPNTKEGRNLVCAMVDGGDERTATARMGGWIQTGRIHTFTKSQQK